MTCFLRKLKVSFAALAVMFGTCAMVEAQEYSSGFKHEQLAIDGLSVEAAIWYPTMESEVDVLRGPYMLRIAPDAPPAPWQFPLVMISHGSGGGLFNQRDTARLLAKNGFIVAALAHPGDNWRDLSLQGTGVNFERRPRLLSKAITSLLAGPFGMVIDDDHIGVLGMSAGGYTALALAGAKPSMQTLIDHCRTKDDVEFCRYGKLGRDKSAFKIVPDFRNLEDKRIKAAAALAPIGALFGPGGYSDVTIPVLLYSGKKDGIVKEPWHSEAIAQGLAGNVEHHVADDAHHFAFLAPFPQVIAGQVGEPAYDPPGFDRRAFRAHLNAVVVAFFQRELGEGQN